MQILKAMFRTKTLNNRIWQLIMAGWTPSHVSHALGVGFYDVALVCADHIQEYRARTMARRDESGMLRSFDRTETVEEIVASIMLDFSGMISRHRAEELMERFSNGFAIKVPYAVTTTTDVFEWLRTIPEDRQDNDIWHDDRWVFFFKDENAAFEFKLRFG